MKSLEQKVKEFPPVFCDWCGKQVRGWYTCPKSGTVSCRPCLDKGYRLRKENNND
ncbi:hypothetical protein VP249E411_P0031 [Vibrio phage 249E41-1]|nr:hypothetical protein VP249E411_P0031 [Vibrio phage 249E41-1]